MADVDAGKVADGRLTACPRLRRGQLTAPHPNRELSCASLTIANSSCGKKVSRSRFETYKVSRRFPREELFGLVSQIRRAAVSIPCNIAEGNGRRKPREYAYHLSVARGSLREVETLAELARGLDYIREEELANLRELLDHVGRMLTRLLKTLEA